MWVCVCWEFKCKEYTVGLGRFQAWRRAFFFFFFTFSRNILQQWFSSGGSGPSVGVTRPFSESCKISFFLSICSFWKSRKTAQVISAFRVFNGKNQSKSTKVYLEIQYFIIYLTSQVAQYYKGWIFYFIFVFLGRGLPPPTSKEPLCPISNQMKEPQKHSHFIDFMSIIRYLI